MSPVIPSLADVERQMGVLDAKLYAKAEEQYRNREIYPEWECYQLDGSTFITEEAFEALAGDEREHYMAWKNGCIDDCSIAYWNEPAVMSYLVSRAIDEDDGGGCYWTDAQPIDYAQSCTFTPGTMLRRLHLDWDIVAATDNGLTYALYGHPDTDVVERDGVPMFVSTRHPERTVIVGYCHDSWVMQALLHGQPCAIPVVFGWRGVPRAEHDTETGLRFRASRAVFDYSIAWVDGDER